jgi:Xaa-Pro dipeptidase
MDCAFMAATRPGVSARDVLERGIDAYREKGYPDGWKRHRQGGSIGYTGRDFRTSFNTPDVVEENQAFTWNPSITGTESEDTILATSNRPVMITRPIFYPTISMQVDGRTFVRPALLEKQA